MKNAPVSLCHQLHIRQSSELQNHLKTHCRTLGKSSHILFSEIRTPWMWSESITEDGISRWTWWWRTFLFICKDKTITLRSFSTIIPKQAIHPKTRNGIDYITQMDSSTETNISKNWNPLSLEIQKMILPCQCLYSLQKFIYLNDILLFPSLSWVEEKICDVIIMAISITLSK